MKKLFLIAAVMSLLPFSANAVPVRYDFTDSGTTTWALDAFVVLDSSSLVASTNLVSGITSWGMSWTDGATSFATNSSLEGLEGFSSFVINAAQTVVSVDICSGICSTASHPEARIQNTFWAATISSNSTTGGRGTWSGPVAIAEPATLALLGIGLLGFGALRRRPTA